LTIPAKSKSRCDEASSDIKLTINADCQSPQPSWLLGCLLSWLAAPEAAKLAARRDVQLEAQCLGIRSW
jgi:hypothetical protein